MSADTIISLLFGIPVAFYCSAVYGRFGRFTEIKREVLRVIRTVDYMQEETGIVITNNEDIPKLSLIVSELIALKHHKAAEEVSKICTDLLEMSMHAKLGRLSASTFGNCYSNWQSMANNLPPNYLAFWVPWAKV